MAERRRCGSVVLRVRVRCPAFSAGSATKMEQVGYGAAGSVRIFLQTVLPAHHHVCTEYCPLAMSFLCGGGKGGVQKYVCVRKGGKVVVLKVFAACLLP